MKLCQIVNLIDKKKVIKMSKRDGNFILVSDILPKLGKDVLKFFYADTKNDAHLDFDVERCVMRLVKPKFLCSICLCKNKFY